jgi:RND family efflux transporter MFP subunit
MDRFKGKRWLPWTIGSAFLVVIIVGIILARGGGSAGEMVVVSRRDVIEEVRVSGTVEAKIVSDLGFEANGVVRQVGVEVNDVVYRGQLLASLGLGTLPAELQSAQASVAIKEAESLNTGINLDAIQEKQDTLVKNARIALYSEGLIAEPNSDTYTQRPPVISGRYAGEQGTYKLVIKSATQNGEDTLYVFGMEDAEPVEISKTAATPLGDEGLYVSFPDGAADYEDTVWYVAIPNTKSTSYADNYSAYQSALAERDRAIQEAQAELREKGEGTSIAQAQLAQARAEVARIQALISERVLRAPFAGVVTAVAIDPGETVTSGTPAISLISNDGFGVEVDLPEIDSIKVHSGDTTVITLDAFSDTPLVGTVASVNRTETIVDGISVYEARIAFDAQDERITSGMTADVAITTGKKEDVLAVPARAIKYRPDGAPYVLIKDPASKKERETAITIGLRGSDGFIEVTAGLSDGDTVLVPLAQ